MVVDHITTLLNFRKNTPALYNGWLLQFVPEDNSYVYFRYDDQDTIMVILNNNDTNITLEMERFREGWVGYSRAEEVLTGKVYEGFGAWTIPGNTAMVLQLF